MANEIDRLKEINKSMQQARDALIKEKEEINASSSDVIFIILI